MALGACGPHPGRGGVARRKACVMQWAVDVELAGNGSLGWTQPVLNLSSQYNEIFFMQFAGICLVQQPSLPWLQLKRVPGPKHCPATALPS